MERLDQLILLELILDNIPTDYRPLQATVKPVNGTKMTLLRAFKLISHFRVFTYARRDSVSLSCIA